MSTALQKRSVISRQKELKYFLKSYPLRHLAYLFSPFVPFSFRSPLFLFLSSTYFPPALLHLSSSHSFLNFFVSVSLFNYFSLSLAPVPHSVPLFSFISAGPFLSICFSFSPPPPSFISLSLSLIHLCGL